MMFQNKHQKDFNLGKYLIEILILINLCLCSDCLILKGEKITDKVSIFFIRSLEFKKSKKI